MNRFIYPLNYSHCFGISACSTIKIYTDCLKSIYKGQNTTIELLIADENNNPIDLDLNLTINKIDSISILLHNSKYQYLTYIYPYPSSNPNDLPITIEQYTDPITSEKINQGIISFYIPETETIKFMSGNLYANITLKIINNTSNPNSYQIKIINKLKIADIKC